MRAHDFFDAYKCLRFLMLPALLCQLSTDSFHALWFAVLLLPVPRKIVIY